MMATTMRRGKLNKGVTFDLGCSGLDNNDDSFEKSPPPVQWSTHPGLPRSLSLSSPVDYGEINNRDIFLNFSNNLENSIKSPRPRIIEETVVSLNNELEPTVTPTNSLTNESENGCSSDETLASTSSDSLSSTLATNSNDPSSSSTNEHVSISGALEQLTSDLRSLQEQDISLLQQLMQIHFSMRMLKRGSCRRTNSVCVSRYRPSPVTPPDEPVAPPMVTSKRRDSGAHPMLSRVQSEPGRYGFMTSNSFSSMEDEDIDEIEEDYLAHSYNATDFDREPSHYSSYLKLSLDLDDGTSDLLEDMPLSLRRKYLNALTASTTIPTNWPARFKNQKSLEQRRQSLSRQDAMKNISRSSSVESDDCIELPAITVK